MNKTALKIAVSPLVIGLTMVGCSTTQKMMVTSVAEAPDATREDQLSDKYFALAQQAVEKGDVSGALVHAEKAVEYAPRDSGYRMLLADLYMKNGRFLSAETAFSDVLILDPGNTRATFNLALAEIALGKRDNALMKLEALALTESAADLGLAYALAGHPDRAVAMLEPAARAPDANARVRQNLALAYALSGDWRRARVTASQDLSPADIGGRMQEWASFVQPAAQVDQIASLLGVAPAQDTGQPVRLALTPSPEPVALAQAPESPLAPPVQVEAEPVEYAAVEAQLPSEPIPAVDEVRFAAAVEALVEPELKPVRKIMPAPTFKAAPLKKLAKAAPSTKTGRFVVQLASYNSAALLEQGWSQLQKRYRLGGAYSPFSATVTLPGKGKFHRLSVAGFGSQSEAARTCDAIKSKGGACFVRVVAGDAPVRWASRNLRRG